MYTENQIEKIEKFVFEYIKSPNLRGKMDVTIDRNGKIEEHWYSGNYLYRDVQPILCLTPQSRAKWVKENERDKEGFSWDDYKNDINDWIKEALEKED